MLKSITQPMTYLNYFKQFSADITIDPEEYYQKTYEKLDMSLEEW
jgi:hypothetical protein